MPPTFNVPNSVSIHTSRNFFALNQNMFGGAKGRAVLNFHARLSHVDPMALAMMASWGTWCRRQGLAIAVKNLSKHCDYAARMKLFDMLGVKHKTTHQEREEIGRFVPLRQVRTQTELANVRGEISALLHLQDQPDALAAVRYCISELIGNVLEHAGSPDGAFVCAHRYTDTNPERVTIGVADCGMGIARHLGQTRPELKDDHASAIGFALQPGVTGARPGMYGTPDNAGAGLFITRCIAKGTGGYFFVASGTAGYRLRRNEDDNAMTRIYEDPYDEDKHDLWSPLTNWQGTAVSVEVRTDKVSDFPALFDWIRSRIPSKATTPHKIRFT